MYKFDGEKSVHEAFEMLRAEVKKAEYEQALSLEKIEYFEQRAIDKIFYDKNWSIIFFQLAGTVRS